MTNFRFFALLFVAVVAVKCVEDDSVIIEKIEDDENSILRTYMNVRVVGSSNGAMCVKCWSGDHNNDHQGCSNSASDTKLFSWNFISGPSTKFWCSATWGSKILGQFPVFGDGVPKKSSDWRVDSNGKMRTHEDGKVKNDYFGRWY